MNPKSRSIPVPHTPSSLPTILGETYYSCDGHGLGPSRFRVQGREGLWFKVQVSKGKRDFPCRARQGEYFNFGGLIGLCGCVSDCDRVGLSRDTVQASGMEVEMSSEMSVAEIVETVEAAPPATATAPPGMRLVITKMVLHNFKSYYGNVEVGPFHKVSLCSDTRLHSPASKSEMLCACLCVCVCVNPMSTCPPTLVPLPNHSSSLSLSFSLINTRPVKIELQN
jgi:hypothetical protein